MPAPQGALRHVAVHSPGIKSGVRQHSFPGKSPFPALVEAVQVPVPGIQLLPNGDSAGGRRGNICHNVETLQTPSPAGRRRRKRVTGHAPSASMART